ELLVGDQFEELHRVVVNLAPERRLEFAKQADHVGLPAPPEVATKLAELSDQGRLTHHGSPKPSRRHADRDRTRQAHGNRAGRDSIVNSRRETKTRSTQTNRPRPAVRADQSGSMGLESA